MPIRKKNYNALGSSLSKILIEASSDKRNEATVESLIPSTCKTSCISLELSIKYNSLSYILINIGAAKMIA